MTPVTIALLWLAVGGIAAYWATFFTNLPTAGWDPCFIVFERAFPYADAVLAGSAALTAEMLRRGRPGALRWGLFAAGQFCFLGLLGASYNLQQGGYDLTPAMLAELFVNVFCLAMAAWLNTFLWRRRTTMGA